MVAKPVKLLLAEPGDLVKGDDHAALDLHQQGEIDIAEYLLKTRGQFILRRSTPQFANEFGFVIISKCFFYPQGS